MTRLLLVLALCSWAAPALAQSGAEVWQEGTGNVADLGQTSGASEAFIRQEGADHTVDAQQIGGTHAVTLRQQGRSMDAAVQQIGSGHRVDAAQHGWHGTLSVEQGALDGASSGNGVYFYQSGREASLRSAVIAQDGAGNRVGQAGAAFEQFGAAHLIVTQLGTANLVMGTQSDGAAVVTQRGSHNTATIIQH